MKCLRKSPADRFDDAASLRRTLQGLKVARPPSTTLRRMLVAASAMLLLLMATGAAVIAFYGTQEDGSGASPDPRKPGDQVTVSVLEEVPWRNVSLADWTNLLPNEEDSSIEYDPKTDSLRLRSTQPMALRFGTLNAEDVPYKLRVRVTVMSNQPDYQSGFFLGYHPGPELNRRQTYAFQELSFRELPGKPIYLDRYRNKAHVYAPDRIYIGPKILKSHGIATAKQERAESFVPQFDFEVAVDAQGLTEVCVNGALVDSLVARDVNGETSDSDYLGDYGILHHRGDVTFSRLQVKTGRLVYLAPEGEQP
jgi:hypothetical protein